MTGQNAVLRAARRHSDHFLRAEVRGQKRKPGHPRRNRPPGEEEVGAVDDLSPQHDTDAKHERAINGDDEAVDRNEMH